MGLKKWMKRQFTVKVCEIRKEFGQQSHTKQKKTECGAMMKIGGLLAHLFERGGLKLKRKRRNVDG